MINMRSKTKKDGLKHIKQNRFEIQKPQNKVNHNSTQDKHDKQNTKTKTQLNIHINKALLNYKKHKQQTHIQIQRTHKIRMRSTEHKQKN